MRTTFEGAQVGDVFVLWLDGKWSTLTTYEKTSSYQVKVHQVTGAYRKTMLPEQVIRIVHRPAKRNVLMYHLREIIKLVRS